ncbi:MAG: hypothetical protein RR275_02095 [Lachnospiraceae bacterium]
MKRSNDEYHALFSELEQYEKYGICMSMDGIPASPMQIVTAHMMKENGCYMRDYITDSNGRIKQLCFQALNDTIKTN